jgi:hypothetical protein
MIQVIFGSDGRSSMHEYRSREFQQAFCSYKTTQNEQFLDEMRALIDECPYDCIVGNGYAAILPLFFEQWGPETRLVHLRRADRGACVASLVKNCELFPLTYRNYTLAVGASIERMAAFHFDEMSKDEWDLLSTAAKFQWYYDKTHALIEQHGSLFAEYIEIPTEKLSEESTRSVLARIASAPRVMPSPVHVNRYTFDVSSVSLQYREKAMWLFGRLDWDQFIKDDIYALKYVLEKFVAWTGYQINNGPELGQSIRLKPKEIAATLSNARRAMSAAIADLDKLVSSPQLLAYRPTYDAALERMQAAHGEALQQIQAAHAEELQRIQAAHAEELQRIQAAHAEQLQRIQAAHAEALELEKIQRARADAERDAVLSSTSWRITALLRRVVDRFRNLTATVVAAV